MSFIFTKTDINVLLSEVFNELKRLAKSKRLHYELSQPRMTLIAFVNEGALRKTLRKLTYDAVKYAEREVHIKLQSFNSDDKMFNIEFKSDGAPIPTEKRAYPHRMAQLHKGALTLVQAEKNKNFFLLSIPIIQDQTFDIQQLQKASPDTGISEKNFISQLKTIIYNNISDIELNVDELAKLMNMSRPTLYRKIKGLSDFTPNELINTSRLKKAAELLSQKIYNITQVATMVGYSVQSNFSRDFHKHYGMSPTIYIATQGKYTQDFPS